MDMFEWLVGGKDFKRWARRLLPSPGRDIEARYRLSVLFAWIAHLSSIWVKKTSLDGSAHRRISSH